MNDSLKQLDHTLEMYLVKKAPVLPTGAKDVIVKFSPWIVLILLILALPAVLALIGLGAIIAPFAFMSGINHGNMFVITTILLSISLVLEAMAIPGLFKREKRSWTLMFYSVLVGAISSLLSFNIFNLIIGTLISLYILYQVKSYYK